MPSFGTVRAAVWAAAFVRVAAAVVLLVRPGAFPLRDYYQPVEQAESLQQQMLHRPRVYPLAEDELAYDALARSILRGEGYVMERGWVITQSGQPTGYGGALYPLFVAAIYGVTGGTFPGVVLVQIGLSVAAVAGMAVIASAVAGPRAALITAWLGAMHPGLAMAPSLLMTEALSIPLIVGSVFVALRWFEAAGIRWAVLGGLVAALGFLVRSPLGIMAACTMIGASLMLARRHGVRRIAPHALAGVVVAALVLTPWTVRNWVHYRHFLPADTKSGVNLWMYNRPPDTPGWAEIRGMNEGEVDALYRQRAMDNIRGHPGWFIRTTLARSAAFWWPLPRNTATAAHWVGVSAYAILTACSLVGVIMLAVHLRQRPPNWFVMIPFVIGWGLMAITATGLRHRLTVEPLLVVTAGYGLVVLLPLARRFRRGESAAAT